MVGQTLERKSKLCPGFVQNMSKLHRTRAKIQGLSSPCPTISVHVQTLSNVCQDSVQIHFILTDTGHENLCFVQSLSKKRGVDKIWTNFTLRYILDKARTLRDIICYLVYLLWTDFGHAHSIVKTWTQLWTELCHQLRFLIQ